MSRGSKIQISRQPGKQSIIEILPEQMLGFNVIEEDMSSECIVFEGLKQEHDDIEEEILIYQDKIENFDSFVNQLNYKNLPIYSWQFHKQADGLCFYKLTRDVNFTDLKFQAKILIDSNLNLKIFVQDYEVSEADIGIKKLEFWEQFRSILENFDDLQSISFSPKYHIQKAIEHLNLGIGLESHNQFKASINSAKVELELLLARLEKNNWEEFEIPETSKPERLNEAVFEEDQGFQIENDLDNPMFEMITDCCGAIYYSEVELRKHECKKYAVKKECPICRHEFFSEEERDIHFSEEHLEHALICDLCADRFSSFKSLRQHMKDSHSNKVTESTKSAPPKKKLCHHCNLYFSKKNLMRHIEHVHGTIEYYQCTYCRKKFQSEENREKHLSSCSAREEATGLTERKTPKKDKFKCPVNDCDANLSSKIILQRHLLSKHGVKIENFDRYCLECKQSFESQNLYYIHLREHFKFQCGICAKKVKTEKALQTHVATHKNNEVRPFSCLDCKGTYKTLQHLKSHRKLIHLNVRKVVCSLCNQKFPDESRLRSHIKKTHQCTEDTPHACPYCGQMFKELQQLKKHVSTAHDSDLCYYCEICNMKFKFLNDMKLHKNKTHGFPLQRRKYTDVQEKLSEIGTEEIFDECFLEEID